MRVHQALKLESGSEVEEPNSHRRMGLDILGARQGKRDSFTNEARDMTVPLPALQTEVEIFHHLPKNLKP